MRILGLSILVVGMVSVAAPVSAQEYDPSYPVCLRIYSQTSYNDCRYTTLAQCNASASGRAGQCVVNPFAANAKAIGPNGRHRQAY